MIDIPYPLINGVRYSWSSVEISLGGIKYGGFTEINYSCKLSSAYARGQGSSPVGKTTGLAEFSADCTYLLSEMMAFIQSLGPAFMTKNFDINVQYTNEGIIGSPLGVITDVIKGCSMTEFAASASNGSSDVLTRKMTLLPMGMTINGFNPVPESTSLSLGSIANAASGIVSRL